jgi:hypothetical protein
MTERPPVPDDGPYDSTIDDLHEQISGLIDLSDALHGFADLLDKWSQYIGEGEPIPWLVERVATILHVHAREALRIGHRLNELVDDDVRINIEAQRGASRTPRPAGAARPSDRQKGGAE